MNHHHGSLRVTTAVADALLANVSARLDYDEIDAVLDCGFSSTLAAVRSGAGRRRIAHYSAQDGLTYPVVEYPNLLDFGDFPGSETL